MTSATLGLGAIGAAAGVGGAGLAPASAADVADDVAATAADQTEIAPEHPNLGKREAVYGDWSLMFVTSPGDSSPIPTGF